MPEPGEGAVWQAELPLLNRFARVPVCGLVAQYDAAGPAEGPDRLPATMRRVLTLSLTLRGFIVHDLRDRAPDVHADVAIVSRRHVGPQKPSGLT